MNIPTSPLQTDFYQFTMSYAYLMAGKAHEITGFESFIRNVKPAITNEEPYYIFKGENDIKQFMIQLNEDINSPFFFDTFWDYLYPKFKEEKKVVDQFYETAKAAFDLVPKNFEYTVIPNGTKVYPMVPVFQFKGPKIFGQMIETPITNIVNGQTGFESYKTFNPTKLHNIVKIEKNINNEVTPEYKKIIDSRAVEYRNATTKILFEAGFRRAPNFNIACYASRAAIKAGWDGTSNTCLFGKIPTALIGGTMAHAFIMAFDTEEEAFIAWNKIYPKSTVLIDTYNTIEAVKTLIKLNIRPVAVRIDSDPIEELAFGVRKILDEAGWTEVKIFLSGDITPEKLIKWEREKVPFDMCMAGTKYVNLNGMEYVNAGFVYKIVEFTSDNMTRYPVKKAFGKSNYPGLKTMVVDSNGNITMTIVKNSFGFENISSISNKAEVKFIEI